MKTRFFASYIFVGGDALPLFFFLLVSTVLLMPEVIAGNVPRAEQLLKQTAEANYTLSYEGTLIYRRPGVMDTMHIVHKADENGVRERIKLLTGPSPREVLRTKDSVMFILSDNDSVTVDKNAPGKLSISQLPEQIAKASKYYAYSVVGRARVADRLAWAVDILPVDNYRFGYRLWIDVETKLLIKSELRNDRDETLEQFFFANLNFFEYIHEDWLIPELSDKVNTYTRHSEPEDVVASLPNGQGIWHANWLPDGFSVVGSEAQNTDDHHVAFKHIMYSDGLAMVSVFIEEIKKDSTGMVISASSIGGVNTFSIVNDNFLITVFGEMPHKTIEQIAEYMALTN